MCVFVCPKINMFDFNMGMFDALNLRQLELFTSRMAAACRWIQFIRHLILESSRFSFFSFVQKLKINQWRIKIQSS